MSTIPFHIFPYFKGKKNPNMYPKLNNGIGNLIK